jgi:FAD/FMN-containing dehydrogenase
MTNLIPADDAFAASLELPPAAFPALTASYLEEPRGRYASGGGLLVAPSSTTEVAQIMAAAHAGRVAVVPYSGGTGLVGGQIAQDLPRPVILSLHRMNKIRAVHADENVLVAEAGVILADVQSAAEGVNRLFPLSLASEGSARIGGVLSTNAGGVNVLRYGNARDLCLGVEAVMPNGEVMNTLTRLRKNNTGYDMRHLLIGAEGSLGIITAAALRLSPRPASTGVALFAVESPRAALELLSLAGDIAGGTVSAFELMHRQGLDFLRETMPETRQPWPTPPDWTVLVDLGGPADFDPEVTLMNLFEAGSERGLVDDGLIAQSTREADEFWAIRETIPEANRRIGSVSSHDISVPLSSIPDFITQGTQAIAALGPFRVNCFGHVGDGNLHFNVFPDAGKSRADYEDARKTIKRTVHDLTHSFGGSVSAEHGIGRLKVDDLERYSDPTKLATMRAIKDALDPHGICNPGAVLRRAPSN